MKKIKCLLYLGIAIATLATGRAALAALKSIQETYFDCKISEKPKIWGMTVAFLKETNAPIENVYEYLQYSAFQVTFRMAKGEIQRIGYGGILKDSSTFQLEFYRGDTPDNHIAANQVRGLFIVRPEAYRPELFSYHFLAYGWLRENPVIVSDDLPGTSDFICHGVL